MAAYAVEQPDYGKSPYTGMTRRHWIDACRFYLRGVFQYIPDMESPVLVKRHEWNKTYPNAKTPKWKVQAERFEGLARTLLLAAPLIHEEPEARLNGLPLREYYKHQILMSCTPGSEQYLLSYQELRDMQKEGTFQHTVECAALVIGLWMCEGEIWRTYTQEERDRIAEYLAGFAYGDTEPHNWRMFNMLVLAFLDRAGYVIDTEVMEKHAHVIASYYAGDGWYRDAHCFDYYSAWAFQTYLPIWNLWYGYDKMPELAAIYEENALELMEQYTSMFDRQGRILMWGRSNIYRHAAVSCLSAQFLLKKSAVEPGLARRFCSGALLQFITREDVFQDGVPCMGFYGPFLPMVQEYSCAESPFWLAKAMLCLALPEEHPFWQETEKESWPEEGNAQCVADGPGIVTVRYSANGIMELRSAKLLKKASDGEGLMGYGRLAYSTQYPWDAWLGQGQESQMYVLDGHKHANLLYYAGVRDGVLYRRGYFDFEYSMKSSNCIDFADMPVQYGLLRVDRIKEQEKATLGGWSVPGEKVQVHFYCEEGARAVVAEGPEGSAAMTVYNGFSELRMEERIDTSPLGGRSLLPYGVHSPEDGYTMISLTQCKGAGEIWTKEELFPIREIRMASDSFSPVEIRLRNGERYTVSFRGVEGRLSL